MANSKNPGARLHECKFSSCNSPRATYLFSLTQFPYCEKGAIVLDNTYVVRMLVSLCEAPELCFGHDKLAVIIDSCYRLFMDREVRG